MNNGKNEFVDEKTIQHLTNLATVNFPDKFLFNEVATILSNKDVKLNPDAVEDLKDLMKLSLSNKAQFYGDGNVGQKVKAIEAKIANLEKKIEILEAKCKNQNQEIKVEKKVIQDNDNSIMMLINDIMKRLGDKDGKTK